MIKVELIAENLKENGYLEYSVNNFPCRLLMAPENLEVKQLDSEGSCLRWINKALSILTYIGKSKDIFFISKKILDTKDRMWYLVKIKNVKNSAFLFETFKKLGISMSQLEAKVSTDFKDICLSSNLYNHFIKLQDTARQQLLIYLISLLHFCIYYNELKVPVSFDNLQNTLTMPSEFLQSFMNIYIYQFKNDKYEFNIDALDKSETFKSCECNYNIMDAVFIESQENTGHVWYGKTQKGNAAVLLNIFTVFEVPTIIGFIKEGDTVYTYINSDLTYENLFNNEFFKISTNLFKYENVIFINLENFESLMGKQFTQVEDITECGLYNTDTEVTYFTNLLSKKLDLKDDLAVTSLKEFFNFDIVKAKNSFDAESVKESYKDDKYAQVLYSQIQSYYDTFNLGELQTCLKGFIAPDGIYSMLFTGPSGTGKSTAARVIPTRCGLPFVSINFSLNIEESDLIGTMVPNVNKKDASEPEFVWQDGILTTAIRNGKLNSLLDDARQIDLPTGEVVKAHQNFRMIFTCNIGYEGTNRSNKALINRIDLVHEFIDLDRLETIKVIKERTGYENQKNIETIYNVYNLIKKFIQDNKLDVVVSIRQLITIFKIGKYFKNAEQAVIDILLRNAFLEEPEYLSNLTAAIVKSIDLSFKL